MRKVFTVEQANRTLPLVSRIVQDIVTQYARWQDRVREYEIAAASARMDRPNPNAEALQHEVQELAREIEGYVDELAELGVEFKGFDLGLVDFPGELGGRPVYLCWKLGEPAVEYWHERDAGYAGRQRLAPLAVA
jgi:hypothetical protein